MEDVRFDYPFSDLLRLGSSCLTQNEISLQWCHNSNRYNKYGWSSQTNLNI